MQDTFVKAWSAADRYDPARLPDQFEQLWETWEIRLAIGELSSDDQFALEATHYRALTAQQAADEIGVPVGTMKSRLSRAHHKLAGRLGHLDEAAF